jgi:hypothetical protein
MMNFAEQPIELSRVLRKGNEKPKNIPAPLLP